MPALSATTNQYTLKRDVLTIYGQFQAVGSPPTIGQSQTVITGSGQSKGVKSVVYDGAGVYSITLEKETGIAQYLGAASFQHETTAAPVGSGGRWARIVSEATGSATTDPKIVILVQNDTGGVTNLLAGQNLSFTIPVSTSKVL